MTKVGEEEIVYESDPEEEKRLLVRRRREAASDDEEGEGEEKPRNNRRAPIHSDESDGQGGAADYDDDEEEALNEEEDEEDEEEEVYEEEEGNKEGVGGSGNAGVEVREKEIEGRKEQVGGEEKVEGEEGEEGKKGNQPFAVPTAGAFYMHDDRFRDSAGGRHRRTFGGRNLWESKDDKKWGHDKFEEMTFQERHYEQGRRTAKGNFRARGGKIRGPEWGYARRNRSKSFSDDNNQNQAPKVVRGRGPRKFESTFKSRRETPPVQNKQPGKPFEKRPHGSSGRILSSLSNTESDELPARKHSSLSSASPPFYPSGSSNKDTTSSQKRDIHGASTSKNLRTPVIDENFPTQQHSALVRGKNIADSVSIDKLYIDDSITLAAGKPLSNMQMPPSGSSVVNSITSSQSRAQGRSAAMSSQMTYQGAPQQNQINKTSPTAPIHSLQRIPAQNRIQPSAQQLVQHPSSNSPASSPPKTALSQNSYEAVEAEAAVESSKSRNALVGKGKGIIQGNGRGSFLYGGTQVVGATTGNIGVGHGDQNFSGTPTFLPVMQFGGQHPGGLGVPAVGMAFPGYVAQPQLGLGNSEMTWLPVLAGAAGALGATYCSPYISVDGAYHARPSGKTSSLGSSSKESSTNIPNNEWKNTQRPEYASDEFGQRQKPRRYSEMDFKQPSTST
ncbi:protein MLN51 homolog [Populus nigra]|uniref:protein MLN51 homolog n=1 Tax=Populus nigra TaxID=3691 RepID=UPI002B269A8F|nr:protein MLN51 homolog [Populus nigra]XP_061981461.1 protein MLN51 homolog [Populus nigra]XP_061981462.1 protein MLN51 homolog [Populus nigra]XP_061981463.1 protein MLN51 homolog [Populus nigra]XP_061981464.1 protein MLN51 homolog [Populus nigra]XP_061981465.1 protein MLN51 homolog [Populus nigra]XP_061981466.1 protein MLN51 homolog [Populus nigra]XP_061981468.1 protein MLN51 homolog [Populus nigra]